MSHTSSTQIAAEEAFVLSLADLTPSETAKLIAKRYDGAAMGSLFHQVGFTPGEAAPVRAALTKVVGAVEALNLLLAKIEGN